MDLFEHSAQQQTIAPKQPEPKPEPEPPKPEPEPEPDPLPELPPHVLPQLLRLHALMLPPQLCVVMSPSFRAMQPYVMHHHVVMWLFVPQQRVMNSQSPFHAQMPSHFPMLVSHALTLYGSPPVSHFPARAKFSQVSVVQQHRLQIQ